MQNVLSILVQNQPGVLVRVAGMFSRRGFNIDSLTVGETQEAGFSRMTVAVQGNGAFVNQVVKQVSKLEEVVTVQVLPPQTSVTRGMGLIKVTAGDKRAEIFKLADIFRAAVVDVGAATVTLEITGDEDKINALLEVLNPYGVLEFIRTGLVGLARGENTIYGNTSENENEESDNDGKENVL